MWCSKISIAYKQMKHYMADHPCTSHIDPCPIFLTLITILSTNTQRYEKKPDLSPDHNVC